ncbi:MAG: tripartite tricarboxylate transporter TctB family protein [Deltaproteobacteria bacterium]|nr:tripartite tricarboxylate transporter TctB family protein [Deltaproteobacteria bacterium]
MKRYNRISSVFWLLVGLWFVKGGLRYGFGSLTEPGAGLLPIVFGALLVVLSSVLFIGSFRGPRDDTRRFWAEGANWIGIALTFLALVAYAAILKSVGFVATTFLFVFFLVKFVGGRRWVVSVVTAVAFALVCYGLFSALLGTPLPKGTLYGCTLGTTVRV